MRLFAGILGVDREVDGRLHPLVAVVGVRVHLVSCELTRRSFQLLRFGGWLL